MKKQNGYLLVFLSLALCAAPVMKLQAFDGGEEVFQELPNEENKESGPGVGIDTKAAMETSKSAQKTSSNTKQTVVALSKLNDRVASGNAMIGIMNGLTVSNAKTVRDANVDLRDRHKEVKRLQNEARRDHGASTSNRTNTATPETATRAVLEGKDNGRALQKLAHDAVVGLMKNQQGCTNQGCQNRDIRDNGGYELLGVQAMSDLLRNGCDYLGICEIMQAQIRRAAQGKVFADVSAATKQNITKLIAAGTGAGSYRGMAQDVGSLCGGGMNNPIKPGEQGMNAMFLAGIVRQPQGENCIDQFPQSEQNTPIAMAENLKRWNCRAQAQGAMQRVFSACTGSTSPPAGSCQNQQAFQNAVKATGMKGTEAGKCSSNIELARDGVGALAMVAGKAGQTEAGNSPQATKGRDAFGRAIATAGSVLGNNGVPGGVGPTGSFTALAELYDIPLFRSPKFIAMLESKEFMVAYANAPALGEGSFYDKMPILIANAWDSIKGNGAILYAEYVKDKPELYAKNAVRYADLFEFKPFPYEKGNMLAHKRHEKLEQQERMYAQQLEDLEHAEQMEAQNRQQEQDAQPVMYDASNITLYDLLQEVGITVNAGGANGQATIVQPISITLPDMKDKPAEKAVQKATDIKFSGHLLATPISTGASY